jgi:hypothetical protein
LVIGHWSLVIGHWSLVIGQIIIHLERAGLVTSGSNTKDNSETRPYKLKNSRAMHSKVVKGQNYFILHPFFDWDFSRQKIVL